MQEVTDDPAPIRVLPAEPGALLAVLPDVPRWLYARSLLLSCTAEVYVGSSGDAAVIVGPTTAVLVGRPDAELVRSTVVESRSVRDLLVQDDAVQVVHAALPGWVARRFVVHALPRTYLPRLAVAPGVVVSVPLNADVLAGLPDDVRADAADAPAAAVYLEDEVPVAVCAVSDMTEGLWDVGIDTVERFRRQGYGSAVFHALAGAMASQGRQPVWAAYEDYPPSLAMAGRLGFQPTLRMAELTPRLCLPDAP